MTNWYKQLTLLMAAASSMWLEPPFADADALVTDVVECREIDPEYQEVYSFETENSYINVCQLDSNFYYYRTSKLDSNSNILAPAKAVFRGDVFQAKVGKINYFVGMDSDRHYSSVMLNNNEIVFEPEIESTSTPTIAEVGDHSLQNTSLELDSSPEDTEQILICAREKSAFHPRLDGWQELIGESTRSANEYAVNNGHSFDYDRVENPNLAFITTEAGTTINLSIVPTSKIVERVCLQSSNKEG